MLTKNHLQHDSRQPFRVLILAKSESYKGADFLSAAEKIGCEVVVGMDRAHGLETFSSLGIMSLDFSNLEVSTEKIRANHNTKEFSHIIAVEDEGTVLAAFAAQQLGLETNRAETVASANDKGVFREILSIGGMKTPEFMKVSISDDPTVLSRKITYPCVLKPVCLSGGRGVIRVDDQAGFFSAFDRISTILQKEDVKERCGVKAEQLLVESYMEGEEIAVEGVYVNEVFQEIAIFDKPEPMIGPYFEESILVTPSRHSESILGEARNAVIHAGKLLGFRHGPVHAEVRLTNQGPVMLEMAPRPIGGHCSRVLEFGAGISEEELLLRVGLGLVKTMPKRDASAAGAMMIPIPRTGVLRDVQGIEKALEIAEIFDVEITATKGKLIEALPEGNRYLGFILGKGKSPEEVEKALREAHTELKIIIDAD